MSATTDAKIQQLQASIDAAKAAYDQELYYNTTGHSYANNSQWVKPYNNQATTQADFMQWLSNSDASLAVKKKAYEDAVAALDNYVKTLDAAAKADALKANPNLLVEIEKAKGEAELTKGKQLFAQATTKYLIWGAVALVIIVVVIVIYKKKFAK